MYICDLFGVWTHFEHYKLRKVSLPPSNSVLAAAPVQCNTTARVQQILTLCQDKKDKSQAAGIFYSSGHTALENKTSSKCKRKNTNIKSNQNVGCALFVVLVLPLPASIYLSLL